MSDLKLFRVTPDGVDQLSGGAVALEKSLQQIFEQYLEPLLGVRFLASEFVTEGGRMDTLGIDENNSPVIIEYKRSTNENVINQGLFYLNWLMSHQADFKWLVMERLGKEAADRVDWSGPRLICIAGDFTRYDEHAVRQMNRNIDLIRYRKYEDGLLLLEQLTSATSGGSSGNGGTAPTPSPGGGQWVKGKYTTVTDNMEKASPELRALYEALKAYLTAQGDDVVVKTTEYYIAYRRMRNYVTVEFRSQANKLLVYARVDPRTVDLESGFTRDMTNIGHFGTGDLEITLASPADLEKAKPFLDRAYNEG
jgi:predicted transport protein